MPTSKPVSKLGLSELLAALRLEIEVAQTRLKTERKTAVLAIKTVEAEVHFLVDKTTSGKGGANIHFFAAEAKHEYKSENVHKLRITLEPTESPIEFAGE